MDHEEKQVELQMESSQFACKQADEILRKWKRARTNKERAKLMPSMMSIKGRLQMEARFIDKMIDNTLDGLGDEPEDRGF